MTDYHDYLAKRRNGFAPPTEPPGRCPYCACHTPTQGHRDGCPDDRRAAS